MVHTSMCTTRMTCEPTWRTLPAVARRSNSANTTIVDIAAASGVSIATVSRIINAKPGVADDTRDRVLRVMHEQGFEPQHAWRQIRSGRTGLIAVHRPEEFNPVAYQLIMAAALAVEEAGYSINIITRTMSETELLAIFRSRQADGIILLEVETEDRRPAILRDHGYPSVMIGHRNDNTGLTFTDVDVEHVISIAMEHLVGLGHRRIGILSIDPVVAGRMYGFGTWALQAYERACERQGLRPMSVTGGPTTEAMTAAAAALLGARPRPSAVIVPSEKATIGIVQAAFARRITIPRDLSIVAMLGEAASELVAPPLTTVTFPAEELGRVAAELLIGRLGSGDPTPRQVFVRPGLTVRGSTASPRG
jgi:DNA-binding LacI/PurR family transcriptional regulator